jgi:hypothetical protein
MPLAYKETSSPIVEPVSIDEAKDQLVVDADNTDDDAFIGRLIVAARQYVEKVANRAIYPRGMQLNLDHFPFPDYASGTVNPNDRHCLYGYFWHALAIRLPKPGALSVESIKYIDLTRTLQTLDPSTYYLDATAEPGRVVPQPGLYWPYTQSWLPGSVVVSYTAGTYVLPIAGEAVQVPAANGTTPIALPLSQLAEFVGMISLVDAGGNSVAFKVNRGTIAAAPSVTVDPSKAGQVLTAAYYVDNCPETVKQAMLLLVSHWYSNRDAAASQPPKAIELGVADLLAGEIFETMGY